MHRIVHSRTELQLPAGRRREEKQSTMPLTSCFESALVMCACVHGRRSAAARPIAARPAKGHVGHTLSSRGCRRLPMMAQDASDAFLLEHVRSRQKCSTGIKNCSRGHMLPRTTYLKAHDRFIIAMLLMGKPCEK